jgi:hypothetical protein
VRPSDLQGGLHIGADPDAQVRWLEEALTLGFDEIYLHHVGRDLGRFIDVFGARVLPRLVGTTK